MRDEDDNAGGGLQPGSVGILRAVIEGTPDAIFVKDVEGRYLLVNSACARFIGKPKEEIMGRRDADLYPAETARRFVEADRQVFASGETEVFEGVASAAGGTQAFRVTKGVVRDEHGRVVGLFGISHDMTERRRAEEERLERARAQAARAEAEEASRMKDLFLATLSHELRTPLTAILGWTSMLEDDTLDAATAREATKVIRRSAEQQQHIINDILDASLIIAGKLRIETLPVELARTALAAVEAVQPMAEAKGVRLICDCDARAGIIAGDPHRLQQVIWNLLSNAVKFTPAGGQIKVVVEQRPTVARLIVSDTGRGIGADFLPYVFDRFRQADSSTTRQQSGLGLGLSIVRYLVEAHGGSVQAYSAGEGQGATFTVDLPLAAAKPAAPAAWVGRTPMKAEESAHEEDGRAEQQPALVGLRVLLVDDDVDALQLLSVLLRKHGAEITAVTSAADALAALEHARPGLLVSDIAMPDMDGYELMRIVRALAPEHGGLMPALALTAYAGEGDRQLALDAGFNAHMAKPIEPRALMAAIAELAEKT